MALNLEQKKAIVSDVAEIASNAVSALAADYSGLTVGEMNLLRSKAREDGVYLRVVRNTLAKKALEGTSFACMSEGMLGPLVLAFAKEEPNACARLVQEFKKGHEKLTVKLIALEGELLPTSALDTVAHLPSRNDAISILMAAMQAPISQFVRTLAEPHAKLVRTLAAIRDKKQAA
ncbi:MAG: 50S ribosomal protein L10 [Pseudomonadota bacterium]|nr:50S ribosomal protein L10 [Gammaproteobacteria bacterium]MBU1558857.1 50S ribosomal protein L10 [Gammaproteobacteria bacterium]MBU1628927.1 50S ribosomal protein L10 [Gammaproteobacteria bacterium]MBU2545921.1 50S ribosomal protein L10 [Gammaproteobacteria bacterium]